jgi:HD-GYP domain-containing protein (c-di-GMP phosphodiesterase class II)
VGYLDPSNKGVNARARVKQAPPPADSGGVATAAPSVATEAAASAAGVDRELDEFVGAARDQEAQRLEARNRWSAVVLGLAFLCVASTLPFVVASTTHPSLLTAVALVLTYAAASSARFEVGHGLFLPSQLVLVPMLFLLPLGFVPLAVCAGLLLAAAVDHLRRGLALERLLFVPLNSWVSVGPVVVLAAAGDTVPSLGKWPLYAGALGAQFGVEYLAHAPRQKFVDGAPLLLSAKFMASSVLVDVALAPIGLLVALAAVDHAVAVTFVLPLIGLLVVFAQERRARIDHALELSHAYRGTALLLGDVVEADDAYTGLHSRDVVSLVLDVCDTLGVDGRERRDAEFVALLHDVGKIKIPSEIINKPGKLTDEEFALIKTHTVEGERLLSQVGGLLGNVGHVVRSCHEDWDGTGYPDGLQDAQIPLVARIVRCCDAFSAMTTDRSYRQALPVADAVAELRRCSGTDFDPAVVEALAATIDQNDS